MPADDTLSPALEAVLERFAGLVRGVGRRYRLSEQEIDELFQEVRLRLWRARGSSEQIALAPTSYVYRTALTAAVDLIRARRDAREERVDTTSQRGVATFGAVESPEGALAATEFGALVASAVETITASRRPVLRMYLAGYDKQEISELMGWSESKTRNLLYRGLADLRAALIARGVGPESLP
jgi:RNA polymerase sigma-70 factor (ECF subfamily)